MGIGGADERIMTSSLAGLNHLEFDIGKLVARLCEGKRAVLRGDC
jgi:hypothetical protein